MKTKSTNCPRRHTPGPWRIGDARHTVFGPPNGNPSPQTIAHLGVIDHEANGALIAAAPELLEAAKMGLEEMIAQADVRGNGNHTENYVMAIKLLEAGIAKAEGK